MTVDPHATARLGNASSVISPEPEILDLREWNRHLRVSRRVGFGDGKLLGQLEPIAEAPDSSPADAPNHRPGVHIVDGLSADPSQVGQVRGEICLRKVQMNGVIVLSM
ncbi:hypothetical protein [Mycolicibacterium vanbaalenii]|uniref:hypothetical protein n=1 Tax=Mycolicibacterium vanbaalenii TaxID=110539 RepID=UPI0013011694|nr:hypothetical protein [Mycolicibacterium vanbaalenii]MCV7130312.1 hypothetical protein [Mycolicibacterium vanbaalenii PYR-1]